MEEIQSTTEPTSSGLRSPTSPAAAIILALNDATERQAALINAGSFEGAAASLKLEAEKPRNRKYRHAILLSANHLIALASDLRNRSKEIGAMTCKEAL